MRTLLCFLLLSAAPALAQGPEPLLSPDPWAVKAATGIGAVVSVLMLLAGYVWAANAGAREKMVLGALNLVYELGSSLAPLTTTKIDDDLVYLVGEFKKQMEAHGLDPSAEDLARAKTSAMAALSDKVVAAKLPSPG